ncbi:hypothetical protein [Aphanothece sacrum]|uniref:Uncharacterized protein n=1 Tax=Aphanothece sacrum FPU1 TaxID=1920663 RepID=A0A401IBU2_APHSA|nr:hypothetical protein [Aphanothece sacrum]GBF78748.1 hypothetical protein AsFPU1_0137 [Aphanothece sacrum FPU1]GBF82980.1 hypothetical protein AsFPU3_0017 [Aphanothece sacrum FPU3]
MAIKDLVTVVALVISASSVGLSLAREEVRCYLGLQSTECSPNNIKSDSLDKAIIKPIINHKSDTNHNKNTNGNLPQTVETYQRKTVTEDNKTESQPINSTRSSEEISRSQSIPVEPPTPEKETHQTDLIKEESVGIPIEVQPFQESIKSQQ